MTRTAARELAMQLIYGLGVSPDDPEAFVDAFFETEHYATLEKEDRLFKPVPGEDELDYIKRLVSGVEEKRWELDGYIEKYANNWKVSRISRTATAIMRVAMYEVLYMDDVPDASALNEAVELAKGYDEQETVSFINGVLGGFIRSEKLSPAVEGDFIRGEKPSPEAEDGIEDGEEPDCAEDVDGQRG